MHIFGSGIFGQFSCKCCKKNKTKWQSQQKKTFCEGCYWCCAPRYFIVHHSPILIMIQIVYQQQNLRWKKKQCGKCVSHFPIRLNSSKFRDHLCLCRWKCKRGIGTWPSYFLHLFLWASVSYGLSRCISGVCVCVCV